MSAIGGVGSNNVNVVLNSSEPIASEDKSTNGAEEKKAAKLGQVPVGSNSMGDEFDISHHSAEARNMYVDEYGVSRLSNHSATRTRSSIGHDDAYFKTDGKISNPAVAKNSLGGYAVNSDGDVVRVQTHGGQAVSDLITGISVNEGSLIDAKNGGLFDGRSAGGEISLERATANIRFGRFMFDGTHNFSSYLGNNLGDMAGANFGSVRYLFAPSNLFQGAVGLTTGQLEDGTSLTAIGGHANSHFFDTVVPLPKNKGDLTVSLDAQSKMALPLIESGDLSNDMTLSSLITLGTEYKLPNDIIFGTKFNANMDFAHLMNDSSNLPITSFAEFSTAYSGSFFDIGANLYVPLTVFDESFSDKITWNVQGGVGTSIGINGTRAGLSASVSGRFDKPSVSKVAVNADFSFLSAGLTVSGIDTNDISVGVNAKVSLTMPTFLALTALTGWAGVGVERKRGQFSD